MNFFEVKDIEKIANIIHSQNIKKGFWEDVNTKHRQCCLIISELADTWIRLVDWHYWLMRNHSEFTPPFRHVHSISLTDELEENIANIMEEVLLIRKSYKYLNFARYSIELLAEKMNFSLESHVRFKMEWNKSREKYHGKIY